MSLGVSNRDKTPVSTALDSKNSKRKSYGIKMESQQVLKDSINDENLARGIDFQTPQKSQDQDVEEKSVIDKEASTVY